MTTRPDPDATALVPAGTMADEAPVQRPPLATTTAPTHHIHYTAEAPTASTASAPLPQALTMDTQHATSHGRPMSDSNVPDRGYEPRLYDVESPMSPIMPPGLRRRSSRRAVTFRNVENYSQYEVRPGWQPGAEPGIDTSKPDGGRETLSKMIYPSEITVVDFSQNDIATVRLDNATLGGFLATPRPVGTKCRWINVNGLSWDVIQMLGNYKRLHRLAIEDLINTRNRTKADWYPTHTFMVLTLQKLVHFDYAKNRISQPDDDSSDSSDGEQKEKPVSSIRSARSGHSAKRGISKKLRGMFRRREQDKANNFTNGSSFPHVSPGYMEGGARPQSRSTSTSMRGLSDFAHINAFRTLQRYHSSPNDARTDFMESHSALSSRNLAVAAEQVSLFITNDNTVISFFELSAQDVEQPILTRLGLPDTSLRRSCDASMVAQAIIDAIIDLAIPVTVCYGDVIADLELDVLTSPSINHTKSLYITISEMNKVLSFINPVMNLINTLRDHKTDSEAADDLQNPEKGVIISPTTNVYLADVLDHCVLITETLNQTRDQAENMISLIFNTISANQNMSMMQLSIVTTVFLPLTFLTGYFGQNFDGFTDLQRGIPFFWKISGPVLFFTVVIMMYDTIMRYFKTLAQRRDIIHIRKHRQRASKKTN